MMGRGNENNGREVMKTSSFAPSLDVKGESRSGGVFRVFEASGNKKSSNKFDRLIRCRGRSARGRLFGEIRNGRRRSDEKGVGDFASAAGRFDRAGGHARRSSNQADTNNMNTTSMAGQRTGSIDPVLAVSVSDPAAHASDPGTARRLTPPE